MSQRAAAIRASGRNWLREVSAVNACAPHAAASGQTGFVEILTHIVPPSVVGAFAHVPRYLLHYRYHAKQMSASPVQQIRYHHRAIFKFFEAHPDLEAQPDPA